MADSEQDKGDAKEMSASSRFKDDRFDREEALIRDDRPAFAYAQDYKLENQDGVMEEHESAEFACSVCRLQRIDGEHIGTGWLLKGTNYIVTCRHVLEDFDDDDMYACFRAIPARDPSKDAAFIQKVKLVRSHADKGFDITVLQFVDEAAAKKMCADNSITGLEIEDPGYRVERGEGIRVIGYPAAPGPAQDPKLVEANFGKKAAYSVLRLSAGTVMEATSKDKGKTLDHRFQHDCSVLAGSSGSPVLNDKYKVIGMHRAGLEHGFNEAEHPAGISDAAK